MALIGVALGLVVGWIAGMRTYPRMNPPSGPAPRWFRHKETGYRYRLDGWARLPNSHEAVAILQHTGRDETGQNRIGNEIWPSSSLESEFEEYVPEELK